MRPTSHLQTDFLRTVPPRLPRFSSESLVRTAIGGAIRRWGEKVNSDSGPSNRAGRPLAMLKMTQI